MQEPIIQLYDFPKRETFILLKEDYKTLLLKKSIKKAGSQRLLAEVMRPYFKDLHINQALISRWLYSQNLRLDIIYWFVDYVGGKLEISKLIGIKGSTTTSMIYNPKLYISLTSELASLVANLYCDGCIESANGYISSYINTCNDLIEQFKINFSKVFGDLDEFGTKKKGEITTIRIPCFIGKLLYWKFNLYQDKIPFQIINSTDLNVKSAYLRAVFDDECSINKIHGQIRLKMKPISFLKDVKSILERDFDIKCSEIKREKKNWNKFGDRAYYFSISGQYNFKKFYKYINFIHPKKLTILKKRVYNYKQQNYGYSAKNYVLAYLKSSSKTVKQIALKIKRDKRTVQHHLNNLKKDNLVNFTKIKNKFSYEYLWNFVR